MTARVTLADSGGRSFPPSASDPICSLVLPSLRFILLSFFAIALSAFGSDRRLPYAESRFGRARTRKSRRFRQNLGQDRKPTHCGQRRLVT